MSRSALERTERRGGLSFLATKIDEKNRLKDAVSTHRTGLPYHLLQLFGPRPTPPHVEPARFKKPKLPLTGVAAYVQHFAEPGGPDHEPPPPEDLPAEPRLFLNPEYAVQARLYAPTKLEVLVAKKRAGVEAAAAAIAARPYDPATDPKVEGDPLKTLFVGRLAKGVTERHLRHELEEYGPIKRVRIVTDSAGKCKGYAFVEFEHKSDMKEAYKSVDGAKIEGKRCVVDVERGRSVPGWLPRRLGGGKGSGAAVSKPTTKRGRDPHRQAFTRMVNRLAGVEEKEAAVIGGGGSGYGGYGGDRDRDRGGRGDSYRDIRDRDFRDRDHRRDRRDDMGGGGGYRRDRDRSDRDSYRSRDGGYGRESGRKRDRYDDERGYGGGGGSDYAAVPPPGYIGGMPPPPGPPPPDAGGYDEPEEGEYVDERDAKRPRE